VDRVNVEKTGYVNATFALYSLKKRLVINGTDVIVKSRSRRSE